MEASQTALEAQLALALKITSAMDQSASALADVHALKGRLRNRANRDSTASGAINALEARLDALEEGKGSLRETNVELGMLLGAVEAADVRPTITVEQTWATVNQTLERTMAVWRQIRSTDMARLNRQFEQAGLGPIDK